MTAFGVVLVAIGLENVDRSLLYFALALVPLGVPILLQLIAFRCPHCGARAVKGIYGYWLVNDTCDECLRAFEGPSVSDDELAEELIAKDNPELARQMRQERLQVEDLRERAPVDPQAAATLERILKKRLDGIEIWVRDMHRYLELGQGERKDVATAEGALKQVQEELAWCKSLLPAGSERSRLTRA